MASTIESSAPGLRPKISDRRKMRLLSAISFIVVLSILFLYAPLYQLGTFYITVGDILSSIFLAAALKLNFPRFRGLKYLLIALVYPVLIYLQHIVFRLQYGIDLTRFFLSYSLWVVSMLLVWASFQQKQIFSAKWVYPTLIFLTILGAVQYFGLNYFHSWFGYNIVAPFLHVSIHGSYLGLDNAHRVRAIGMYYEPSMFGRVIATLMVICFFQKKSFFNLMFLLLLNIYTTRSLGLVVLGALSVFVYVYGSFSLKRYTILLAGLAVGFILFQGFVVGRIVNNGLAETNSTYIRVVLPLDALATIIPQYPLGVPIGSNEKVVENTIGAKYMYFGESKITNGFYEFLLYFGVTGFAIIFYMLALMGKYLRKEDRFKAMIIMYMLLSTVVSSSYLSIESSFLLYIFIVSLRRAHIEQNSEDAIDAPSEDIGLEALPAQP